MSYILQIKEACQQNSEEYELEAFNAVLVSETPFSLCEVDIPVSEGHANRTEYEKHEPESKGPCKDDYNLHDVDYSAVIKET